MIIPIGISAEKNKSAYVLKTGIIYLCLYPKFFMKTNITYRQMILTVGKQYYKKEYQNHEH
jgi:hypothetical protein